MILRALRSPAYRRTSAYIACLIPLLLGSAPGHSQGCFPLAIQVARIQMSAPDVQIAETLTGEAATRFMEAWNEEPPPTNETADLITTFFSPHFPDVVMVIVSNEGCVVTTQGWAQKDYQKLKRGPGQPS